MSKDKLIIFDTTLRDGEQSPGAAMSREDKLRIAKALERLKVDVIEAGFPASSPGDFAAVKGVAEIVKDSRVCALARTGDADIDRAGGRLEAELSASGTLAAPELQGTMRLSDGEIDFYRTNLRLREVATGQAPRPAPTPPARRSFWK